MTDTRWTPGPWKGIKRSGYVYAADCVVCVVGDFKDDELKRFNKERWAADTCLIAAVPDLYNALTALADVAEARGIPVDAARAALKKARNE